MPFCIWQTCLSVYMYVYIYICVLFLKFECFIDNSLSNPNPRLGVLHEIKVISSTNLSIKPTQSYNFLQLTHWGQVMHICVGKLTIIGSDNGLSPERRQAIIWTNAGILLIGPLGTNFSEILIEIKTFSLKKIRLKMSSAKWCSFRLGLNVLQEKGALTEVSCNYRRDSHNNWKH